MTGASPGEVGAADRPDVDLPPEPEHQPPFPIGVLSSGCVPGGPTLPAFVQDTGACGGGADGVVEELGGGPSGRFACGAGGAVEADDGMEMDLAAFLVFGDLGVGEGGVVPQGPLREPGGLGDLSTKVGGEACPQGRGVRVPQDRARVVVVLGVERGAEQPVGVVVPGTAVAVAGVGLVVDGAEAGGGEGGEDAGVGGDAGGDGLAAA